MGHDVTLKFYFTIMNEIEKMRNGELADMSKPEMQESFIHAKKTACEIANHEFIR